MATMREISAYAGVSVATVSKIINGQDQNISEATRERVLKLVKQYNYRPNELAKGLKERKSYTLGFILPDITNPFFPEIARGIEDAANRQGFAVVFCDTDNDPVRERESVAFLRSKMAAGIIFSRSMQRGMEAAPGVLDIPTVFVDRVLEDESERFGLVYVDTRSALAAATELLLRRGRRRLAFIGAQHDPGDARYKGFVRALEQAGLAPDESLVVRGDYSVSTGYEGTKKILAALPIDGVVCGNDLIAAGAMKAIHETRLQIPRDISVVGMDNIFFTQFLNPPLTTVEQPAYDMGRLAAEMLIDHIVRKKPLYRKAMEYRIIPRETV